MELEPTVQPSRLLSLPYEIRMQIYRYCIPSDTELTYCPCLDQPTRANETDDCLCQQPVTIIPQPPASKPPPIFSLSYSSNPHKATRVISSSFRLSPSDLFSAIPLTCKSIHAETKALHQPKKSLIFCSPRCMNDLLVNLSPIQLSMIEDITLAIDLRVFRPPLKPNNQQGEQQQELPSFHDIWRCIYTARLAAEQSICKFYQTPTVDRMKPYLIHPAMDFYPLAIIVGRTFTAGEMAAASHNRQVWLQKGRSVQEKVAELKRIVARRNRVGLPEPARWRLGPQGHTSGGGGGMVVSMGRGSG